MSKPLIFLSHCGQDTADAKELARLLVQQELEVWLDVERLKPGDRWVERIEEGLRQATALVVYVGKSGVRHWVDQEVRVALDRCAKERDFRLIPVLGHGSTPEALPLFLQQYQWLDLREGWTNADQFNALLEGMAGKRAEGVSLLPPGKSPFQGLQAFDVEDSLVFFGRDAEIPVLLDMLRADSFLAVVGDSGSGKSSLVRAGLIPALHRGRFHDGKGWSESWRVAIVRPGDDPFGELAEGLTDLSPGMSAAEKAAFLRNRKDDLVATREGLRNAIASLVPRGTRTLLVIDQFEELFTLTRTIDDEKEGAAKEMRRAYLGSLFLAARLETERPVHVVITLRADFYSRCWEHDNLTSRMARNQYNVQRANAERLRDMIEKPLGLAGAKVQDGLVDAILSDAGDEPGTLPLLEHALSQMWDKRVGLVITHDAYQEIGRLGGALKNHANRVLNDLGQERRSLARKIFLSLTQVGEGAEDTRRRVRKGELIALDASADRSARVLQILTDARLLTSSREVGSAHEARGTPAVVPSKPEEMLEVSHEALIREWPELRQWINESRDELLFERRLAEAAAEWQNGRGDEGLLWSGTRLARAREWGRGHEKESSPTVRAFLNASWQQARMEARKVKRLRDGIVGLVSLTLLMAFGFMGWMMYQAQQQAKAFFDESVVTDPVTGLMWTRVDNLEDVDWDRADQYCRDLTLAGLSDWRLPTLDELEGLRDREGGSRYRIRKPFRLTYYNVWSSEKQASDWASYFNFAYGLRQSWRTSEFSLRALCVRRFSEGFGGVL